MLTLKRFKALMDSYGAQPQRWPDSVRADAEALLRVSPQAQQLLADAGELDAALDAAREDENTVRWPPGAEAAALGRLRAGVAARLAGAAGRSHGWFRGWLLPVAQWSTSARLAGMATVGGLIIGIGLLLGSMDDARSASQVDVLAMLQPDPLPFQADQ